MLIFRYAGVLWCCPTRLRCFPPNPPGAFLLFLLYNAHPTRTRTSPPLRAQLSEPEKQKDRDIIVVAIASYDQSAASTPAGIAGIASSADEIKLTATELGKKSKMRGRRLSAPSGGIRLNSPRVGKVRHSLSHASSVSTPAERAQAQAATLWSNAVSAALHAIVNAVSLAAAGVCR